MGSKLCVGLGGVSGAGKLVRKYKEMIGPLPIVPGHEGAGIVEEVGPGVTLVEPGGPCQVR